LTPSLRLKLAVAYLWCLVHDGASAVEVARLACSPIALVVVVERVGRVRHLGIRIEAPAAALDGAAVRAVSARPVQRRLQPRVADLRSRHAPARRLARVAYAWLLVDNGAGAAEVASLACAPLALVVVVHGVGGVRDLGVRAEARRAGLDGAAIRAVAARVVQRRLQPRVPDPRVRHAPAARRRRCRGHGAAAVDEVDGVHRLHGGGVEEPEVALRVVALLVLVEESEDVRGSGCRRAADEAAGGVHGTRGAGAQRVRDEAVGEVLALFV